MYLELSYSRSFFFCSAYKFTEPTYSQIVESPWGNKRRKTFPTQISQKLKFDQSPPNRYDIHSRAGRQSHLATRSSNRGPPRIYNQPYSTTTSPSWILRFQNEIENQRRGALHATTGVVRHLPSLQCFQHARGSRIRYFRLHGIPSCGLNLMLSAPMKMPDPNQC